jgi:hypothetical protein
VGLYADQLAQLQAAIVAAENGDPYVIGARTYGAGDLTELYAREELTSIQAAIEAIQGGSQAYTIHGRSFTLADLATLYTEREAARVRLDQLARKTRGGMRLRRGVSE